MRPAAAGPKCRSLPTPAGPKCRSLPTPAGLSPAPAFRTASKNNGVTLSRKEESLRRSWKHFRFRMSSRLFEESLQMYVRHFFQGDFFSTSGDYVCFRTAWKNYGVTMSWKEESLRRSCKHFCFRMSSRLFEECLKTMVSRGSERNNLCGCLGMTYA